ncbi:MAG: D-alanine--D-alanine ligase family protein [Acidobacteriota bacterium]
MTRVGLVFGGRSVEHEVSIKSARTVDAALRDAGFDVVALGIAPNGVWLPAADGRAALDGDTAHLSSTGNAITPSLRHLLDSRVDVVFPIVHGTWGEDGTLQGLCEMLDLPYVGCGVAASAVAMDKIVAKQVLAAAGVAVVPFEVVDHTSFADDPDGVLDRLARFTPPLFVKPAIGGSSVGVTKVSDRSTLRDALAHSLRFAERALVEPGVAGRELECAVLGDGADAEASVIGEIVAGADFYDYADKYLDDNAELIAPAELPARATASLQRMAVAAFAAVGGSGLARVDFLLDDNFSLDEQNPEQSSGLYVNEINTLPGFTSISMYPQLWELSGVPRPELVRRLVDLAVERHARQRRLDDGIKTWIAELTTSD